MFKKNHYNLAIKNTFMVMMLCSTIAYAGSDQSRCPASRIQWGNGCTGVTIEHTGSDFKQYIVSNSTQNFQGSANVQCYGSSGEQWTILNASCDRVKNDEGGVNGSTGSGSVRDGNRTESASDDSTSIGNIITGTSTASPPVSCNAQNVNWTASGFSCQGYATDTPCQGSETSSSTACPVEGNSSILVSDSNGKGSAYYRCNGTNGQFELSPGSADCSGAIYCPAQSYSWTEGGQTCSTNVPANSAGVNVTHNYVNNVVGKTGNVNVECVTNSSGNLVLQKQSGTCTPIQCPSQTVSWSSGIYSCSGPINQASYNNNQTVSSMSGNIGDANFNCSSAGAWNYVSGTCALPSAPSTPTGHEEYYQNPFDYDTYMPPLDYDTSLCGLRYDTTDCYPGTATSENYCCGHTGTIDYGCGHTGYVNYGCNN